MLGLLKFWPKVHSPKEVSHVFSVVITNFCRLEVYTWSASQKLEFSNKLQFPAVRLVVLRWLVVYSDCVDDNCQNLPYWNLSKSISTIILWKCQNNFLQGERALAEKAFMHGSLSNPSKLRVKCICVFSSFFSDCEKRNI